MTAIIFEVIESDAGGFEARAYGHSIFTQGEDWHELEKMVEKPCFAISTRPKRLK